MGKTSITLECLGLPLVTAFNRYDVYLRTKLRMNCDIVLGDDVGRIKIVREDVVEYETDTEGE